MAGLQWEQVAGELVGGSNGFECVEMEKMGMQSCVNEKRSRSGRRAANSSHE
jgi:hypothetical protein